MTVTLLLLCLFFARINSSYNNNLYFKRYITIKNSTAAKILIDQSDPLSSSKKNAKPNRNKLLLAGIVFYCLCLELALFSVIMYLLPAIPTESTSFLSEENTLNAQLPPIFAFILFAAENAFYFFNTAKYAFLKTEPKKLIKVLYISITAISLLAVIGGIWAAAGIIHSR